MRGLTDIPDGAFVRLAGIGDNPDKFMNTIKYR